jgi:hypothetical protein
MEILEIIVISVIGVSAVVYLAWIFFGRRKKNLKCGSCPDSASCDKQKRK